MTLTAEQFNKLVTKVEFNELKDEVGEIKTGVRKILNLLDGKATKDKNHEIEHISNIATHDHFERRIKQLEKRA